MKEITIDLDKFLKMYYANNSQPILKELADCEIKPVNCDECINYGETCNKCIHNKFSSDYFEIKE